MMIRSWLLVSVALASLPCGCTSTSSPESAGTAGAGGAGGAGGAHASGGKGGNAGAAASPNAGNGGAAAGQMAPSGAAGWQAYRDTTPATLGSAERGKYLVDHVLVCGVCHTPSLPSGEADTKLYLAGSRPYDFTDIDGTVITVNAENLTSHDPEGLHAWTDGQIRTAITKGVDDEHYAIYPIMPYPEYALLEPADVDSI